MSDDLEISEYGKASVEAGQGYQAMPDTRPLETDNAERANAERTLDRLNTAPEPGSALGEPLPVHYHEPGDPNKTSDPKLTLEPERAAKDLADWRRGHEEIQQAIRDTELSAEIERLKAAEAQSQPQQQPAEPVAQRQPEPLPLTTETGQPLPPELQTAENEELVKAFQREPKLLEAMNTLSWQTDQKIAAAQQQALQYAEMQKQQAEQFVQANAKQAIAGIFVRYPELQNLSQQELPLALNLLQRSNPERHAAIMHEIAGIQGLLNESNRVAQVQQQRATQQYHQQFHQWGGEEDSKFVKVHPEMADSATASGVMQKTRNYVNKMGFTDDDIARAWNGQAHLSLRDARVQSMLYDAMRYREAVAAVPAARANKPVKVQTPGPSGQVVSQDDSDLRALSQRLTNAPTGTASVRAAAELLAARRAKSR
jgi:hypothetical protein